MSSRPGFKQTEIGEIPEDWEVVKLHEIAIDFISGGTPSTSRMEYWNGSIPWMRSASIKGRYVDRGERFITEKGLQNSAANLVPKGSLLIATRVSIGNVAINNIDIAISQDLTGVIINKARAQEEFLYWALEKNKGKLIGLNQGSTIKGILRSDLRNLTLPLPSLPEQKKIATILSTVDDAIQKTDEIIAKTERLKKGLMQRLLTRGMGHTKFRQTEIGEIPEEWKTSSLAEVCHVIMGQSPPSETYNRDRVGLPFLQGRMDFGDIYPNPSVYCSKPIKIAEVGDILVSVRAPVGDVNIATSKCCIGRGLAAIRSDKNQLDSKFIFYQLRHFSTKLAGLGSGSTFKAIRRRDLEILPTVLPSLPEQKKIASVLSTVDEQIEKERAKKGHLEQLKKGLMQVLLTGKVRVKVN
jgi:type I restriction enzyme S subunit